MKEALIGFYAQSGDKVAIDKLLTIAKSRRESRHPPAHDRPALTL